MTSAGVPSGPCHADGAIITNTESAALPAQPSAPEWPPIAVVMVVRNEARHLPDVLRNVLSQDYPGPVEVAIAIGPSRDDTLEVAAAVSASDPRVVVVPNPTGRTPTGLNAAVAATSAPIVARVDGHSLLPPGYLRRAVEVLTETAAVNVGGVMAAEGTTPFERAVAAAMSSPFGVGGGRFHYGGDPGPADTVYLGVFRRDALAAVDGYDERFTRAQDWELNHRLRRNGGKVWFTPDLRVVYRPRSSLRALAVQYRDSAQWRRAVIEEHPDSVRLTYLVPPVTVAGLITGVALAATGRRIGLLAPATYALANLAASVSVGRRLAPSEALRLPAVFATMHLSWGWGFLTSPKKVRARAR
ncbi:MAG TPA: glycosyltransferase family 2 protein [Jatrophihabitans sp.]|uniref:glycosyltransferase family 2 protein n=1 Tax=Jatrophihabitans sp. TaxID=1932789 RepID=UPI002EDC0381